LFFALHRPCQRVVFAGVGPSSGRGAIGDRPVRGDSIPTGRPVSGSGYLRKDVCQIQLSSAGCAVPFPRGRESAQAPRGSGSGLGLIFGRDRIPGSPPVRPANGTRGRPSGRGRARLSDDGVVRRGWFRAAASGPNGAAMGGLDLWCQPPPQPGASAWSRSAIRSSASSMPTESRTRVSVMPS